MQSLDQNNVELCNNNIKDQNTESVSREQDLIIIKEWLKQQPHLPDEWDDVCLRSFLRNCSNSLEKTKRKLDMYFTMRAACPEFFTDRDISRPELMDLMVRAQNPTMPGLTPEGRRVTYCRGLHKNLETRQLIEAFKIMMMVCDVRMFEETDALTGDVYVFDIDIVSPGHLKKMISPVFIKKFLTCAQEAYPLKLKEVHVVNVNPIIDLILNIVKPFLKEKIRKRIILHKECNGLLQYLPKDKVPLEYGGTGPSLVEVQAMWLKKLTECRTWFKAQESIKANETLRPGKPTNYDELFGIEGSFRQLAID